MNLAELREMTLEMVGESTTDPVYWTNDEIDRYINDAYQRLCLDTKALEGAFRVTAAADTQVYTAPDGMLWPPFRAIFDGRKLANVTKWEMDRTEPDWENQSGYVSHYLTTLQNDKTFRLFKAPDTAPESYDFSSEYGVVVAATDATFSSEYGVIVAWNGGGALFSFSSEYGEVMDVDSGEDGLILYGVKVATELSEDTDEPELPEWSHVAIAAHAAARAFRRYGETRNPAMANLYTAMGDDVAAKLRAIVSNRVPERLHAMSTYPERIVRKPQPWEQTIED